MKNLVLRLLFIIMLFSQFTVLFSQDKIDCELSRYFSKKFVYDMVNSNGVFWFINSDELLDSPICLTKYNGERFINYYIPKNKIGPLNNYCKFEKTLNYYYYNKIFSFQNGENECLIIYNSRYSNFVYIKNDTIVFNGNLSIACDLYDLLISQDDNNNLWLIINSSIEECIGVYKLNMLNYSIDKINIPFNIGLKSCNELVRIDNYFIIQNNRYFLFTYRDSAQNTYNSYFVSLTAEGVYKILFADSIHNGDYSYKSISKNDTLIIINNKGYLWSISQNKLINHLLLPVDSSGLCFWFDSAGNDIYYSNVNYLYLIDNTSFKLKWKSQYKSISIRNVFFYNGLLYGINSIASKFTCNDLVSGITIVNFNK